MRKVLDWSDTWAFSLEAEKVPDSIPANWLRVRIPHTWNNADGTDGGNDYYRGTGYYARVLKKAQLPEADLWYLQLDGTNASADVYVNGVQLGHHDGGYSTWRVNITDALTKDENLVVVAVNNEKNNRVYPQQADFTFYGGMYRKVYLVGVSRSHFCLDYCGGPGIAVIPKVPEEGIERQQDGSLAEKDVHVSVRTWVTGAAPGQKVRIRILDQDGETVAEKETEIPERDAAGAAAVKAEDPGEGASEVCADLVLPKAHLWNGRKDPYLYTVTAELPGEDNETLDAVSVRTGIRAFRLNPEKGFILNGVRTPLHGAARHQDRAGKGNALDYADHLQDMDILCEMGANTVRLAHYQHSQDFYDLCDERGMVVWAEIPYISKHMPEGRENTVSQMRELIVQNISHPCIAVWGLSNEITMGSVDEDLMENHRILNDLVHRLDPSRKTVMAFLGACSPTEPITYLPDALSYNLYRGWYDGTVEETGAILDEIHKDHPDQPLGLSEYGADALNWHTDNPRKGDYTEEYQALYHEKMIAQLIERPYLWATYVWNLFDFGADGRAEGGGKGQNTKGLVTFDRAYKKDAFYAYKAWLSDEPFVHLCGKRRIDRQEDETEIKVYSNQPAVELFVNGRSIGVNDREKYFFHFRIQNSGTTHIRAAAAGAGREDRKEENITDANLRNLIVDENLITDEMTIRKVEKENPAYVMKDPGIVLNWFDLTVPEGYYSLNDTVGDIRKSPEALKILTDLLPSLAHVDPKMNAFFDTMTGLRIANFMVAGTFGQKVALTKEQLLATNAKLNTVPKN